MTQQRDISVLLDIWLAEGSTFAPDRVIDVVTDRIERQRQRGAWRFPRRDLHMPAMVRIAAVAAALAVLAGGAIYFGGSSRPNVPPTTPGPSPTPLVPASPSQSPYVLPSGLPYQSPGTLTSIGFEPKFQIDAPLGWTTSVGASGASLTLGLIHDDEAGDSGNVGGGILIRPNPVLGNVNSCPSTRSAAPTLGPPAPAAEIVQSLLADPRFAVVAGPDISIGGLPAQVLDVRLATGFTGTCTNESAPSALLFDAPGSFVLVEGNQRMRVILLDVEDVPLLILISPVEESYDAFVTRAMGVIQTIVFLP